jgi:hypothetical protein
MVASSGTTADACLDRMDQWSIRVHRPCMLEFGAPDEVERMVLLFAVSAESWCS